MKKASDFRKTALECLKGHWLIAVIAGLLATLLGGGAGVNVDFDITRGGGDATISSGAGKELAASITNAIDSIPGAIWGVIGVVIGIIVLLLLVAGVAYFILGSFVEVGYAKFNLNAVDGCDISVDNLFSHIAQWKRTALVSFWKGVYIMLWTCLFIVPGIVATYSYSMTKYIMAENNDISPKEAIAKSNELMCGNKWRLFCLKLSFIGWDILAVLTLGIGNLWLTPYKHAAEAAFYRDITEEEE
ncbi:MAG: DUF975 family protein [Clostridia bacterium]|nr:DUF975 family protein [Clostridia bacterium]